MARRRRQRRAAAAKPEQKRSPPAAWSGVRRRVIEVVRRRPLAIVAGLVLLHVALALVTFAPQPHTGGDNAAYIALGRSLLEHGTYTELWDPAAPPHTKYPPAFPAVLAAAMAAGLQPWVQLKLVVLALSATAVAFSFLWLRARRRAALALGIGIVLAAAPGVLREGRWILSDVPFWAFTMLALWAFERLRPHDWKRFAIAAVATLVAYFTRSAGLPLALAALAWLAWRRRWTQLGGLAVIVGVPALLWWLRGRAFGPSGYVSEFWLVDPYVPALGRIGAGDLIQRIAQNDWKYMTVHLPILLSGGAAGVTVLLSLATSVLALGGWIRRMRAPRVADLFLPLYVSLIFIWPAVWSGERFLLPALVPILFYAAESLRWLMRRLAPRHTFVAGAAAAALLLLLAVPGLLQAARASRECMARYSSGETLPCLPGPVWDDFFDVAELAPAALPDGAVVLSRKPRLFYALGGLRGRTYPFSPEPEAFFAAADSAGARYVVYDGLGGTADAYLRPVLLRKPDAFCIMHVAPLTGTVLFGIRPDHARVPDAGDAALSETYSPSFAFCDESYWRSPDAMRTFGVR
ncbi:MAG TPA: hypothetical protein VFZ24_05595 [Longimicrobiales bacterium]